MQPVVAEGGDVGLMDDQQHGGIVGFSVLIREPDTRERIPRHFGTGRAEPKAVFYRQHTDGSSIDEWGWWSGGHDLG